MSIKIKTKILFIYGPLNAGGAERVLLDYLQNLDRTTYEISLCLLVNGGTLLHEVPKDITTFSLFPSYNWYYKLAYRLSIWFGIDGLFQVVIKRKMKQNYDVIISFLEGMPLKIHTLIDSKARNFTWVHVDLDNFRYTQDSFFQKNELKAYEKMDQIICVSNDTANAFIKRFPTLKKKTNVIYNPIHIKKILDQGGTKINNSKELTCILAGRLTKQKSIDRFLYVVKKFENYNEVINFQILGDGELRRDLETLAKALQVDHLVSFLGYQSNPYPYIRNAAILVSTSSYEGFGLVLCEAMALGVPVVSTKTAGPIEIIGDNEFGILCNHEVDAIYDAVKKLLENDELRALYIQKGYERVKDFSLENALMQFNKLIENYDDL